jgi:hypothetical protein
VECTATVIWGGRRVGDHRDDRGADVKGSSAWQKSITYKLATYWEGWKAGRHVQQFGLKQMGVVMLTSSEERMKQMLGVVNELTQGRGSAFFLFGHAAQLCDADPLNVGWISGRRQPVRLTD